MPAPLPAELSAATLASYSRAANSPYMVEYLDKFFTAFCNGWQVWQNALSPKGILVTGAGTGTWTGTGTAGTLTGALLKPTPFSFGGDSPYQVKFQQALFDSAATKFDAWVKSFVFSAVNYVGTTTATALTPGSANAENTPTPLSAVGQGTFPAQIHGLVLTKLVMPDFDLSNPTAEAGNFAKALASAIETGFATWTTKALFSGDIFEEVVLPAGVATEVPSKATGKVV